MRNRQDMNHGDVWYYGDDPKENWWVFLNGREYWVEWEQPEYKVGERKQLGNIWN